MKAISPIVTFFSQPDSEECNVMVFCEKCNICVHQACYGITSIPSGPWVCKTCSLGIKPKCELCPNRGGAMKSTKSGQKWAHVSCALWIPEVSIGCVEKMEPITKISSIPVMIKIEESVFCHLHVFSLNFSAKPLEPGVRPVQGARRVVHPVLGQDLQDRLPRHLRLQARTRDESHHRGRERRGRRQTQGKN